MKYLVCADTESGNRWKTFQSNNKLGSEDLRNDARMVLREFGNLYKIHYIREVIDDEFKDGSDNRCPRLL